jgi:hypothetical protein
MTIAGAHAWRNLARCDVRLQSAKWEPRLLVEYLIDRYARKAGSRQTQFGNCVSRRSSIDPLVIQQFPEFHCSSRAGSTSEIRLTANVGTVVDIRINFRSVGNWTSVLSHAAGLAGTRRLGEMNTSIGVAFRRDRYLRGGEHGVRV